MKDILIRIQELLVNIKNFNVKVVPEHNRDIVVSTNPEQEKQNIAALTTSPWFTSEWVEECIANHACTFSVFILKSQSKKIICEAIGIKYDESESIESLIESTDAFLANGHKLEKKKKEEKKEATLKIKECTDNAKKCIDLIEQYTSGAKKQIKHYHILMNTQDPKSFSEFKENYDKAMQQIDLLSNTIKKILHSIKKLSGTSKSAIPSAYCDFTKLIKNITTHTHKIEALLFSTDSPNRLEHLQTDFDQNRLHVDFLVKLHETIKKHPSNCQAEIRKLQVIIHEELPGVNEASINTDQLHTLWLHQLTGCKERPWNWTSIRQQLQRIRLFRMMQTDALGNLNLSDCSTHPQSQIEKEIVFFTLFNDIVNAQTLQSLVLEQHDLEILRHLDTLYWKRDGYIGSHAIHILANCGERGDNGNVINYCRLMSRLLTIYEDMVYLTPKAVTLKNTKETQNWNILNYVLFHYMRVSASEEYRCDSLSVTYPGLISLIRVIKKITGRSYLEFIGERDYNRLFKNQQQPKRETQSVVAQFLAYANCLLVYNKTKGVLELAQQATTPRSRKSMITQIAAESLYVDIAAELLCLNENKQLIHTLVALQQKAKNKKTPSEKQTTTKPNAELLSTRSASSSMISHHQRKRKSTDHRTELTLTALRLEIKTLHDRLTKQNNFKNHALFTTSRPTHDFNQSQKKLKTPYNSLTVDPNHDIVKKFFELRSQAYDIMPSRFHYDFTLSDNKSLAKYQMIAECESMNERLESLVPNCESLHRQEASMSDSSNKHCVLK